MHPLRRGLAAGLIGGAVGLLAMELVRRATSSLVTPRAPKPTDVFVTERSISPFGPQHRPGEPPTVAFARIAYHKLVGRDPTPETAQTIAKLVHYGFGLVLGSLFGVVRGRTRHPIRDGALFGAGLWTILSEVTLPLFGLADRPTAYSGSHHAQLLASNVGYGVATAATTKLVGGLP